MSRQFSLKRLLVSMTLLAIGLASWGWCYRQTLNPSPFVAALHVTWLYLAGGALTGAGVGCLIGKTLAGALLGYVFGCLLVAILFGQK